MGRKAQKFKIQLQTTRTVFFANEIYKQSIECHQSYSQMGVHPDVLSNEIRQVARAVDYWLGTLLSNGERELQNIQQWDDLKFSLLKPPAVGASFQDHEAKFKSNRQSNIRSCSYTDLRDKYPTLKRIRHQGKTSWCYAFTAAELASARLGQQVSPIPIALLYYEHSWNLNNLMQFNKEYSERNAGEIKASLDHSIKYGFCRESEAYPNNKLYQQKIPLNLEQIKENFNALKLVDASSTITMPQISAYTKMKLLFPGILAIEYADMFVNHDDIFTAYVQKYCEKSMLQSPPLRVVEHLNHNGGYSVNTDDVDQVLDSGKPVGVVINPEILTDSPIDNFLDLPPEKSQNAIETYPGQHAVTIIGRRYNNKFNRCEYLTLTHWADSDVALKEQRTDFDGTPQPGLYPISKSELSTGLLGYTYIEN